MEHIRDWNDSNLLNSIGKFRFSHCKPYNASRIYQVYFLMNIAALTTMQQHMLPMEKHVQSISVDRSVLTAIIDMHDRQFMYLMTKKLLTR